MTQPQWGSPSPGQRVGGQQPAWSGYAPSGRSSSFSPPGGFSPYGQPGPGQPGPPAPQRRRSPLGRLLAAITVLAILASIGFVATLVASPGGSRSAYQNDDFPVPAPDEQPPDLPRPQTYEEARQMIEANPFYQEQVPIPVRCDEGPIDVTTASDAELERHLNGMMECLYRVWQPPVTEAGWEIVRPTVTVYSDKVKTKCGESGVNASYCTADQQVYFSNQLVRALPAVGENKWVAYIIIAHEFAHALQARTNILISAHALAQDGSKDEQLEMSRRIEVQADCLSAMFLRSVSRSLDVKQDDLEGIEQTYRAIGDDSLSGKKNVVGNHGLARSRLYWANQGLGTSEVGTCNTYVADKPLVR